VTAPPIIEKR